MTHDSDINNAYDLNQFMTDHEYLLGEVIAEENINEKLTYDVTQNNLRVTLREMISDILMATISGDIPSPEDVKDVCFYINDDDSLSIGTGWNTPKLDVSKLALGELNAFHCTLWESTIWANIQSKCDTIWFKVANGEVCYFQMWEGNHERVGFLRKNSAIKVSGKQIAFLPTIVADKEIMFTLDIIMEGIEMAKGLNKEFSSIDFIVL
jgi:hypothetical protein